MELFIDYYNLDISSIYATKYSFSRLCVQAGVKADFSESLEEISEPVQVNYDCPLDVHCSYTRDQILVALDFMKPGTMQEGSKYFADKNTDIHLVTLNKSDKDYSPTTMYNDYSINETLFHWQTKTVTSDKSPTGQRYINHRQMDCYQMLFVR